jgi:hypothetical protein
MLYPAGVFCPAAVDLEASPGSIGRSRRPPVYRVACARHRLGVSTSSMVAAAP